MAGPAPRPARAARLAAFVLSACFFDRVVDAGSTDPEVVLDAPLLTLFVDARRMLFAGGGVGSG